MIPLADIIFALGVVGGYFGISTLWGWLNDLNHRGGLAK